MSSLIHKPGCPDWEYAADQCRCGVEMRGDLVVATTVLAADNARLCEIALAADALAEACETSLVWRPGLGYDFARIRKALDAFKVVRNGT